MSFLAGENKQVKLFTQKEFNDNFFEKDNFRYSLNFYDFEVFAFDWCLTVINPIQKTHTTIVNNVKALKQFYNEHCDEIWVGYNSRNYDSIILKSLLLGMNPKQVNDDLIVNNLKGWQINSNFKKIKLYDFDVYVSNPLKILEGFMGNAIFESEIDFNIKRVLTSQEIKKTLKYNKYDVMQTIEVFKRSINSYNTQIQLIETFGLDISSVSLTQSQLIAEILDCRRGNYGEDEFDLDIVETLKLKKYKQAKEWFEDETNMSYKKSFNLNVCGVPHQFGWGGLHGCNNSKKYYEGNIYHIDVNSYYPSLIIFYNFMTRCSKNKKKYKNIFDIRMKLKSQGKRKEQEPFKLVLNKASGIMRDKYSSAYDPRQANNVCVNGQLLLTDLLEHLEPYVTVIQSNTDGIFVQLENETCEKKFKLVCERWEKRSGVKLSFDSVKKIYQKDVNNYLCVFDNGKIERKGSYVLELDELNYDLPIVNKALVDYMVSGVDVETTINNCNILKDFQKLVKITNNYEGAFHNGKYLKGKYFRVFASKNKNDTYLGKYKRKGATIEKFANTPSNVFIMNGNVNGVEVVENLDKQWYIDLAKKRLNDFGIETNFTLF